MKVYVLLYMVWHEGDEVAGVTAFEETANQWVAKGSGKFNPYHYLECELEQFELGKESISVKSGREPSGLTLK